MSHLGWDWKSVTVPCVKQTWFYSKQMWGMVWMSRSIQTLRTLRAQSCINLNNHDKSLKTSCIKAPADNRGRLQSSSAWRRRMIFISPHYVSHMHRSTLVPHQSSLFSCLRHRDCKNLVNLIYIWGTVMAATAKQNWQNLPIFSQKGADSPRLWCWGLQKKKRKKGEKGIPLFWCKVGI